MAGLSWTQATTKRMLTESEYEIALRNRKPGIWLTLTPAFTIWILRAAQPYQIQTVWAEGSVRSMRTIEVMLELTAGLLPCPSKYDSISSCATHSFWIAPRSWTIRARGRFVSGGESTMSNGVFFTNGALGNTVFSWEIGAWSASCSSDDKSPAWWARRCRVCSVLTNASRRWV